MNPSDRAPGPRALDPWANGLIDKAAQDAITKAVGDLLRAAPALPAA